MASESDNEGLDLFQEPADYYEPEKQPTFASHTTRSGQEIQVRLVGHNPLWVRHHPVKCPHAWLANKTKIGPLSLERRENYIRLLGRKGRSTGRI